MKIFTMLLSGYHVKKRLIYPQFLGIEIINRVGKY